MENFDKQKEILDHYNFHKRIMPTESKEDFSKLSPVELVNKRNSIRSLITRRKQTLEKRIAELTFDQAKGNPDLYALFVNSSSTYINLSYNQGIATVNVYSF